MAGKRKQHTSLSKEATVSSGSPQAVPASEEHLAGRLFPGCLVGLEGGIELALLEAPTAEQDKPAISASVQPCR